MKYFLLIMMFFSAFSATSHAIDRKRNGGHVLDCGQHIEVMDLYESRALYGNSLGKLSGVSYPQIARSVIEKLKRHSPRRYQQLVAGLSSFHAQARFIEHGQISGISDIGGGVIIPQGCKLVPAVFHFSRGEWNSLRYVIDKGLWDRLDELNRAALVVHELVYRIFLAENPQLVDASGVRFFVAYLFSSAIESAGPLDFLRALRFSDLSYFEHQGVALLLYSFGESLVRRNYELKLDRGMVLGGVLGVGTVDFSAAPGLQRAFCFDTGDVDQTIRVSFEFDGTYVDASCGLVFDFKTPADGTGMAMVKELKLHSNGRVASFRTQTKMLSGEASKHAFMFDGADLIVLAAHSTEVAAGLSTIGHLSDLQLDFSHPLSQQGSSMIFQHEDIDLRWFKKLHLFINQSDQVEAVLTL